jgi:hypothetical protein
MIRTRKFTVTYELPEELFNVLEEQAKREGRPMEEVIAECKKEMRFIRPPVSPEEEERLHQELISQFGTGISNDPHSSNNERIDEDLAREYEGKR